MKKLSIIYLCLAIFSLSAMEQDFNKQITIRLINKQGVVSNTVPVFERMLDYVPGLNKLQNPQSKIITFQCDQKDWDFMYQYWEMQEGLSKQMGTITTVAADFSGTSNEQLGSLLNKGTELDYTFFIKVVQNEIAKRMKKNKTLEKDSFSSQLTANDWNKVLNVKNQMPVRDSDDEAEFEDYEEWI